MAATQTVAANDDNFSPSSKTIPQGDRINWNNPAAGSHRHTSTSNASSPVSWNFNMLDGSGLSPTVTFGHAGAFAYHCEVHASMKGTIRVSLKNARIDSNSWTIRMSAGNAPSGFVHQLQFKKSTSSTWQNVGTNSASPTKVFNAPSAGTWNLRARYIRTSTNPDKVSGFSPTMSVMTQ
jgi:plastocyanin